ncbi:hypothetical protein MTR67_020012 [Solanum verrucosum]|uniref:Uncharacterized protein n=1 Tax=Solanum verrucosum TaxID=315347 RepID=A0AAF0QPS9_SOLVR|nr:hypothetical protein MTR67_020012 [Solanum verrucosum]
MKIQSRISTVLESLSKEADIERIQEDLREIVQEMRNAVIPQSTKSIVEITLSSKTATESQQSLDDGEANLEKEIPISEDSKSCNESIHGISKTLADAMSQIHDFVLFLGKEAKAIQGTAPDGSGINEKLDNFSATYVELISNRYMGTITGIGDLDHVCCSNSHWQSVNVYQMDMTTNSQLPWLHVAWVIKGIQSLNFQGFGVTPFMQPRFDDSLKSETYWQQMTMNEIGKLE